MSFLFIMGLIISFESLIFSFSSVGGVFYFNSGGTGVLVFTWGFDYCLEFVYLSLWVSLSDRFMLNFPLVGPIKSLRDFIDLSFFFVYFISNLTNSSLLMFPSLFISTYLKILLIDSSDYFVSSRKWTISSKVMTPEWSMSKYWKACSKWFSFIAVVGSIAATKN